MSWLSNLFGKKPAAAATPSDVPAPRPSGKVIIQFQAVEAYAARLEAQGKQTGDRKMLERAARIRHKLSP